MGHSVTIPLDEVYLTPTIDLLFEEYKKAIPELTISSEQRQRLIIARQEKELTEKDELKKMVYSMAAKLKRLEDERRN